MQYDDRIITVSGEDAYEAGVCLGKSLGNAFGLNIAHYTEKRTGSVKNFEAEVFQSKAIPWLEQLSVRFRDEFTGLAEGANLTLQQVAEWAYIEVFLCQGCSSVLCRSDHSTWLAHNNDTYVPEMWGHITVRNIRDRLSTMCFGLAGDVWTTAGVNEAQLWLHLDHLSVSDQAGQDKMSLPTYGFTVEALEICETIADVSQLLKCIDRDDGMILGAPCKR